MKKRKLTAANIRYLLAIGASQRKNSGARCVDVADSLGVSKPSVHSMVSTLQNRLLVRQDRYGYIFLTDAGRSLYRRYTAYFEAVSGQMRQMLDSDEEAGTAACAVLAEVSEDSLARMIRNAPGGRKS